MIEIPLLATDDQSRLARHRSASVVISAVGLLFVAVIVVGQATTAAAQDTGRFEALRKQFERQYAARDDRAAQQTAKEMRRIAEGSLRRVPAAMIIAVRSQAIVLSRLGNHDAAVPLMQRGP